MMSDDETMSDDEMMSDECEKWEKLWKMKHFH
jgi:hypothetical protein